MSYLGYDFYFKIGSELLTLPITPSKLTIKSGSNNKVVTLINEGDVNILKSPSLTEISFEARFPMRKYPYSREPLNFEDYLNKFTDLKTNKKSFVFSVIRTLPNGKGTWGTSRRMALEELTVTEDANEGDDVILSFNLKEYKEYGITTLPGSYLKTTTSTAKKPRPSDDKGEKTTTYVVEYGDCLWTIAKAAYDDGSEYMRIYNANKEAIEADARKHGKSSSNKGNWIWPGLKLTIPGVNKKLNVKKLW